MYRVLQMSGTFYAIQVDIATDEEQENITIFTGEGKPVILVQELSDLEELDIDPDGVEIVKNDES